MAAPASFADAAPSWATLEEMLAAACAAAGVNDAPDLENGATNPHALLRLFGQKVTPRVKLYRDSAAWCPCASCSKGGKAYASDTSLLPRSTDCEKVWLQLEEKQIPYSVEKVNMRCYGDKPKSFLDKVPSGAVPALELDGKLYTESAVIANLLEKEFPATPLLPAPGTQERKTADVQLRLERQLFSTWMGWLTSGWGDASGRTAFEAQLGAVEASLASSGGPYFGGSRFGLVDVTFAPFLERMAASMLYYKGLRMRGTGRWPRLEAWFDAMESRPTYAAIQSDFYTHAHDLPPQLGGCEFNDAGRPIAALIDGARAPSSDWHLPLPPLSSHSLEPYSLGENMPSDALLAASKLIRNRAAVTRFAARGCGLPGTKPVSAPLADPTARPGEQYLEDVDAALRLCAHSLLTGEGVEGIRRAATGAGTRRRSEPAAASAAYLRDRVGVPRDLRFPAARRLRAHLNALIDALSE